jgi:hypothetical protein
VLVNPGGLIGPDEVVGRDELIARIWRRLQRQSVVLTSERRTGKTSILHKMKMEVAPGFVVLTEDPDVEGLHSPLEFVERVYRDAERHLRPIERKTGFRKAFEKLAGFEIGGVIKFPESLAPDWKPLLEALLDDLASLPGEQLVFLWDEMPVFINNVRLRLSDNEAAGVLDVLRAVRQRHRRIRMVFTGSIGFHTVTAALTAAGVNSPLLNDMWVQDVPPLAPTDGVLLAGRLLEGEGVHTADHHAVACTVTAAAGHIPFYIHHIVDALVERGGTIDESSVDEVVTQRLRDDNDPLLMSHYLVRTSHYPSRQREVALALLDILAREGSLGFERLFSLLQARLPAHDEELARGVVMLLRRDHYITQSDDGTYAFRSALLRQWWRHERAP